MTENAFSQDILFIFLHLVYYLKISDRLVYHVLLRR